MDNVLFDSQGIYNYVVSAVELNKIKAAEGRRILILIAAVNL